MGSAEFLDAVRMLALEASTIVDARLEGDNLILIHHDDSETNVGSVRGIQGIPGGQSIAAKAYNAAPSTYPTGMTSFAYVTTTGWPTSTGTVFSMIESIARGFQLISEKGSASGGTGKMWFRTVAQDAWSQFYQIIDKAYVDAAIAVNTGAIAAHDALIKGTEIAGSVDLDSIIAPGLYTQSQNADAISGLHYPVPLAGMLEVAAGVAGSNLYWQSYTPYSTNALVMYRRSTNTSGVWSPWYAYNSVTADDTGWISAATAGFAGVSGNASLTTSMVRRRNGVVALQLAGALTSAMAVGNVTNLPLWTIPSGWIPTESNGQIGPTATGSGWSGYASSAGQIILSNNYLAKAAAETITGGGTYLL